MSEPICSFCNRALTFKEMKPDHWAEYECAHCGADTLIQEVPESHFEQLIEEYETAGIDINYGGHIDDYPDSDDDDDGVEHFKLAYEYEPGDTQPNATDWIDDCGYDLDAGFCDLDGSEECLLCPYRQAIGDTAR